MFKKKKGTVHYISLSYCKVQLISPNKIVLDNFKIGLIERNIFRTTIAASFNRLNKWKCPLNKAWSPNDTSTTGIHPIEPFKQDSYCESFRKQLNTFLNSSLGLAGRSGVICSLRHHSGRSKVRGEETVQMSQRVRCDETFLTFSDNKWRTHHGAAYHLCF